MKVYGNLMEKAKSENRIKTKAMYYENHHIIPDFMFINRKRKGPKGHLNGNPNDPQNLVLLTTREHILAHILLAKGLKGKRYWAQAASSLMWFFTKVNGEHSRQKHNIAGAMRKYSRYRALGLSGLSKARLGTFPAIDSITRESVGSVSNKHPKVLSGEWVHHSKGKTLTQEHKNKIKVHSIGSANPNFKEMTEERRKRVFSLVRPSCYIDDLGNKFFMVKIFIELLKKEFIEFKKISIVWVKNNFNSIKKFIEEYNIENHDDVIYKSYGKCGLRKKN